MPEDENTNQELLKEFRSRYKEGLDAHSDFWKRAKKCFDYYGNQQWERQDIETLKNEGRPALVFNQVAPVINSVAGSEVTNKFETRFYPRTVEDVDFADRISETVRYVRNSTDADHEESAAFMDCVISGLGCVEFYQDYSKKNSGFVGKTVIERVPVFEMSYDPSSRKSNLEDANWIIRGKWIPEKEFKNIWGEELFEEVKSASHDYENMMGEQEIHDQTASNLYASDFKFYDYKLQKIAVYDYQKQEKRRYYVVTIDNQPQAEDFSKAEYDELLDNLESELGISRDELESTGHVRAIPVDRTHYERAFISGSVVLSYEESPVDSFTYRFITGFRHEKQGRIEYFGLMDGMIDPQKWSNKMLSQLVHVVATNPKGAIIAEKGVFDNPQAARTEWGKPNPIIEVRNKALVNKEFEIVHGKYPDSIERIMDIAVNAVPRVTGLGPYFTSQIEDLRRTAGSAVRSVQQRGMVVLSVLFDSLRKYRKMAGRLHLEFIDKFMPEDTLVRITEDPMGPSATIEFKRDWIEKVEYDIVVDEAPTTVNALSELWDTLVQTNALGILIERQMLTMDIVADIMPNIPASIRQRMKENFQKQQEQQQQMMQMGMAQGDASQEPQ